MLIALTCAAWFLLAFFIFIACVVLYPIVHHGLNCWFVKQVSVQGWVDRVTMIRRHNQMIFNGKFFTQVTIPDQYFVSVSANTPNGKTIRDTITKSTEFFKREYVQVQYVIGRLTKEPVIVDIK